MHELTPEVLVATEGVVGITLSDLVVIRDRAARSARKRARLCAHPTPEAPLHEMLICLGRDTYIRPHRHRGKSESFHIIDGELDIVLFEGDGTIREVISMGPYQSGRVFFYRLAEPCFHSVLVNTSFVLFHETTNGPFNADDTEFAEWAPLEETREAIGFINRLRARRHT